MPRKKLSEYRSKVLVSEALGLPYVGWAMDMERDLEPQIGSVQKQSGQLVVKVDQGVKGRFKKGLVLLNVAPKEVVQAAKKLHEQGYRWLLVEPMASHVQSDERYLCLTQDRDGLALHYSDKGGVDVESNQDSINHVVIDEKTDWQELAAATGLGAEKLERLVELFRANFIVLLEINPYIAGDEPRLLDLAIEVDDAGAYFVDDWSEDDFRRSASRAFTSQEETVQELAEKSPASFKLDVLNPDGAVFLLLSGGGASIVVADEVYNHGLGEKLANYGEYSGNPNTEETYIYTKAVLELLVASKAKRKVLFVGGAVANFTDIANTFGGVIRALDEFADKLKKQHVRVFVRRGGPRQEIGLAKIEETLKGYGLLGAVHSPATPLPEAVKEALEEIT